LWCLGYPEQALQQSQHALALARELGHPFSLADVLCYAGSMVSRMRREELALRDYAEELMRVAGEKVPVWLGIGTFYLGVALTMLGQVQEGIAHIREGMSTSQSFEVRCFLSDPLCSLAEAQARSGRPGEGLATLAEALALVEETDERHWEAEIYRLKGELLLMRGADAETEASLHQAESCFEHAIDVARHQQAKSWELRATVSLCRLWQKQGRIDEARQMLAGIYGWFTEGFHTPDLEEARSLLQELS
jgi:predicted ATPase